MGTNVNGGSDNGAPDELMIAFQYLADEHPDTLSAIAHVQLGVPERTATRPVSVAGVTLTIEVALAGGTEVRHLELSHPVLDRRDLRLALLDTLGKAREEQASLPLTTLERERNRIDRIATHLAAVRHKEMITPRLMQLTVGGTDLVGFTHLGPDEFVFLLGSPPGRRDLTVGRDFSWTLHDALAVEDRPRGAYYTVRRLRPEIGEIDLWVVMHEHGQAVDWVREARVGDPVALWGPRAAFDPPEGTERVVLLGDETALPAIASILETLDDGVAAMVRIEVADDDDVIDLPHRDNVDIAWVARTSTSALARGDLVDAALALRGLGPADYVWGGGESRAMTSIRQLVRHDVGLMRRQVSLLAYWRRER